MQDTTRTGVVEHAMNQTEDNASRLNAVFGSTPRYLTVAETARASGLSRQAVYRAIGRGELRASLVCSRIRIHPDDFLAWMDGDRAAPARGPSEPRTPRQARGRVGARKTPAPNGLRSLLATQRSAAA
jgi:excisionase family DNA binding protein